MSLYANYDCDPMEVLYQRRCAKYIYVVPEGLRELMADITREVLRCQPHEIYCFVADYLDALFITRENARVAALFVEDVTEAGSTLRDIIYRTKLTVEEAVRAVRVIQRAFRRHLARRKLPFGQVETIDPYIIICKMMLRLNITYDKASSAAKVIQNAWRCYKLRMDVWRARFENPVDWRDAARYTLRLYKKYAATWEYTKAATLIQAAYRGYYTRRVIKMLARKKAKCQQEDVISYLIQQYESEVEEEETTSATKSNETLYVMYDPEDRAARTIQRAFRSHFSFTKKSENSPKIESLHHEHNALWDENGKHETEKPSTPPPAEPNLTETSVHSSSEDPDPKTWTADALEVLEEHIKQETEDVN